LQLPDPKSVVNKSEITGNSNKRLLAAVFGDSIDSMICTLHDLAATRVELRNDVEQLQANMVAFAHRALEILETDQINLDAAFELLKESEPLSVSILSASYGPKVGTHTDDSVATRADVKWILQPLVYNSLLRIPKDAPLSTWFGTTPNGQEGGQPYTLDVEAETASGPVNLSIAAPEGMLESDLIVSSAQPTQNIPVDLEKLQSVMNTVASGKIGLEIGGPSAGTFQPAGVYKIAKKTDLVNFSEKNAMGDVSRWFRIQLSGRWARHRSNH